MKNRRTVLALLSMGGIGVGSYGFNFFRDLSEKQSRREKTAGELVDFIGAHEIGFSYLTRFPEDSNPEHLLDLLLGDLSPDEPEEKIRAHLNDSITRDYEETRVHEVDGWFLSQTELRLFALASRV
ncbi:MAG: hypothetical protein AAF492_26485 [Verrucomicrobiota bacterium]